MTEPKLMLHPDIAKRLGVNEGERITIPTGDIIPVIAEVVITQPPDENTLETED